MPTVRQVTSSSGLRKFQAAWFLLNRGYKCVLEYGTDILGLLRETEVWIFKSPMMWQWVTGWMVPDVSKNHTDFSIEVKWHFFDCLILRCRHYNPSEFQVPLTPQHSITSQKTSIFSNAMWEPEIWQKQASVGQTQQQNDTTVTHHFSMQSNNKSLCWARQSVHCVRIT